jgi:type IV pilus assembly protein PilW
MKYNRGFSLLELLIAITIGLVLMAGVLAVMSSTKKTYSLQEELSRLQEDARFLMEDLSYNVRMAGYFGCSGIVSGFTKPAAIAVANNQQIRDSNGKAITKTTPRSDVLTVSHIATGNKLQLNYPGTNEIFNTKESFADLECENKQLNGVPEPLPNWCLSSSASEINLCQRIVAEKNYVKTNQCHETGFSTANAHILLHPDSVRPNADDLMIITDCAGAQSYEVASVSGSPPFVVLDRNLRNYFWPVEAYSFTPNAEQTTITDLLQVTYEVRAIDKNGDDSANDPIDGFALFRNGQLFIEGVQSMQIRYGVDTVNDGLVDRYVEADQTPIGNVISVRINLFMRTANKRFDLAGSTDRDFELDPDLAVYNPSNNIKNEEGYRHRLFTMTIRVRNS